MNVLPGALAALAASDQFVTWFAYPHKDPAKAAAGKMDKIPCLWHSGAPIDAHNPANWTDAGTALATHHLADRGHGSGVGFVFTENDPFFCHDIDGAYDGNTWSDLANAQVARFAGAAVEVSHSGRGLHIIGRITGPPPPHSTKNIQLNTELYFARRFIALTGTHATGDAGTDHTAAYHATAAQFFPPTGSSGGQLGEWTTEPVPEWEGTDDDAALIDLARRARTTKSAFGGGWSFDQLWTGDVPDDSRSEADQSLANHLAFWTGKNCERIERLMYSAPCARPKYDEPRPQGTYLRRTILAACAHVTKVASNPRPTPAAPSAGPGATRPVGDFLAPDQQLEHFAGCTFISEQLAIYNLQRNKLLTRGAFDVEYGGKVFVIDAAGEKTSDNPYHAFTQSRVNRPPIVDDMVFRPGLAPGEIIREGEWTAVNTYVPYECLTVEGDVSRWLRHLSLMLPDETDRNILVQYLARVTQHPGVKVPWWPVLQGVKGNGKGLLAVTMEYIAGEKYSHRPNTAALAKDGMKFNKWLARKTFVTLDELSLSHKRDFMEELKPIVTESRVPYEPKGVDSTMGDNSANGLVLTNHKDGLPIDDDERRYAIFYCAQQSKADLMRDGMTEAYFFDYRGWLLGIDGHAGAVPGAAHVAHYLKTYALPAVLPSRAPLTTARPEAVRQGLGQAEQLVIDAIEEGRQGFAGGWVSGQALDKLLETRRIRISLNKRPDMMHALGYELHTGLPDGRTVEPVAPDNVRTKLYVRAGHLSLQLPDPVSIGKAYSAAQTVNDMTDKFGPAPVIDIKKDR